MIIFSSQYHRYIRRSNRRPATGARLLLKDIHVGSDRMHSTDCCIWLRGSCGAAESKKGGVGGSVALCTNLGSCYPCACWFNMFRQPKGFCILQRCHGAMVQDWFSGAQQKVVECFLQIPQVTKKTKKQNNHDCWTSTRVTNKAERWSCCHLGSGASLRCHLCDIYYPADVWDGVVRGHMRVWVHMCLSTFAYRCVSTSYYFSASVSFRLKAAQTADMNWLQIAIFDLRKQQRMCNKSGSLLHIEIQLHIS